MGWGWRAWKREVAVSSGARAEPARAFAVRMSVCEC